MHRNWINLLIPGLLAMSHLSAAAESDIIMDALADEDSIVEAEPHQQHNQTDNKPVADSEAEGNAPVLDEVPKTRFGIGYEQRQSLRPELFERPERPDRPERPERPERPDRPDRPERFGQ